MPTLAELIKDSYVTFGTKTWDKNKVSAENLKKAIIANPRLLVDGWTVNGAGQIVRTPTQPVNDHGPATNKPTGTGNGSTWQPPATTTPEAPVTPPTTTTAPTLTPEQMFQSFIDGTYQSALRNAQTAYRNVTDKLNADKMSLTETRAEYGGGTLYDKLLADANKQFSIDRRGLTSDVNRKGLLRSGFHNQQFGNLTQQSLSKQNDLDKQYGAGAIRDIDTQLGQANENLRQNQLSAAEDLIGRVQQNGTNVAQSSVDSIMNMLQQYGGKLPVGGN